MDFANASYTQDLLVSQTLTPAEIAEWFAIADSWRSSWRVQLAARVNRWWYRAMGAA